MHQLLFDFISKYVSLTEEEKQSLLDLDIFHAVGKGKVLLKAGEYTKEGYFVLEGCLRKYYMISGEEKTTAFYTEMEGLTPECVVTNEPSEYYVATTENSILTISTLDMEVKMLNKFPKFEKLCRILSEELLLKEQIDFDNFKTSSPEERYLNLIEKRPDLIQRIPQHQLASYLGIKPQSLSRLKKRILEKNKR